MSRFDSLYPKNQNQTGQTVAFVKPSRKSSKFTFPLYYFYRSLRIVLVMWIGLLAVVMVAPWADYYVKKSINSSNMKKEQAPQQVLGVVSEPEEKAPVEVKPAVSQVIGPTFYVKKGDLEISAPITKGIGVEDLNQGVGHHPDSVWPNQKGNVVIAGHSFDLNVDNKFGRVFEHLRDLDIGDQVQVSYQGKTYYYEITKKETVASDDSSLFGKTQDFRLTFYTCDPPKTDWRRLVFQAELIKIE